MVHRSILPTVVGLLLLSVNASGLAIYDYSGNSFESFQDLPAPSGSYTTAMRVTGSFVLAAPLAPNLPLVDITGSILSFTLDDGRATLTESTPDLSSFEVIVRTDSSGLPIEWSFEAIAGEGIHAVGGKFFQIRTTTAPPAGQTADVGSIDECTAVVGSPPTCNGATQDTGFVQDNPGTWSAIPEPTTAMLLATGLAGLAMRRRHRVGFRQHGRDI